MAQTLDLIRGATDNQVHDHMGGNNLNFYKHHLGDYDSNTSHLSWDEDMAYTRLMRIYYRRELPLPQELPEIYRLSRAVTSKQKQAISAVLSEFFKLQEGAWHNKRCDEEIAAYQSQASTNRRIARQRFGHEPLTNRDEIVNLTINQNQNHIPEPKEKKKGNGAHAPCPDDRVDSEVWREFEQHRVEIRKPLTTLARKKNAAILGELTKAEQRVSVDTTIANRWTGLFPPKHKQEQPQRKGKLARAMESYNARHGTDNRGGADRDAGAEPRKLTGG